MADKTGNTICNLEDLTFPVELRDNPRNTNREYSKVVTGIITKTVPYHTIDEINELCEGLTAAESLDLISHFPETKVVSEETDLNYCSPRYELVPNSTIFPKVEDILNGHGIKFNVTYSHTDNTRFYANYEITDERFSYKMKGTNDRINFIWNFQHSYNGLTKYRGIAGFFRLICSNGLVVPVEEMNDYNLCIQGKHTSSILHSLEQFSHILTKVSENFEEMKESIVTKYETLGGRWVAKPEDRIEEVLKATKIANIDNSKFNTMNVI